MLERSACIEWLFTEGHSFADRIRLAAAAGLPSVEFWTWRDKDMAAIAAALAETGIGLEAFVSQPEARLVDSGTHDAFVAGVDESACTSAIVGCTKLIVVAGDSMPDKSDADQHQAVVASLRRAGPVAAQHGVTLLLEPLNSRVDHVGHYLDSTHQGLEIVEEVDLTNVRLLLDVYHAAVMDEPLAKIVGDRLELVGHVHIADTPGRHEPGTGAIDWPRTVKWLQQGGYAGRLGLEFRPTGDTLTSLSFIDDVIEAAALDQAERTDR